ncbi:AbiU2 domain-containing protein [Variovorax arabinosiphilus]|uniref:AbiU2 domain-containing protein n=1 Tax=Variovorax arabinosiphilus TaxID=3053498 RepID=UPI0025780C0D|nr:MULTISPECIES: hypothetical protein [unclassified Variovorax]MDM0121936.1 hypothetical protein [Variovorax sp. J2L1-78]MDM0131534.1 hypothetical protein [Variovorax sp. J2L1-63]MDM0234699.1 hypothetical protein [Variovorax sp. J2R1-6]
MSIQSPLAMPGGLRQQYDQLYHEILDLHFTWSHYLTLFGKDAARVDLLNACSPNFFALVERELWNSMLLRLTRITAEAQSGHKASTQMNLTIRTLPRLVDVPAKSAVKSAVRNAIEGIEFCAAARNKYLAHLAVGVALDRENAGFDLGSRKQINGALRTLVTVLDAVTSYYDGTTHLFDVHADAEALLRVLGHPRSLAT